MVNFDVNEDSDIVIKMNKDKKVMKLYSKKYFGLHGDLDILTKFGYHCVSREFM